MREEWLFAMTRLETQILRRIDELIQYVISLSLLEGVARQEQFQKCCSLVAGMGDMLLEVLEGRKEHLQALLEQLIAQRLPDKRLLKSFGTFNQDLQEIIAQGLNLYLAGKEKEATVEEALQNEAEVETATGEETEMSAQASSAPDDRPPISTAGAASGDIKAPPAAEETGEEPPPPDPEEATRRALLIALQQAFPGEEIVQSHQTRGGTLLFYLPRLKLGFELARHDRRDWRRHYYCRQEGITLISLEKEKLAQPSALVRYLKKAKTGEEKI
ncbi:MAG: hypothetical protein PWP65_2045 [Clostridia bacterium]|nr:hypothetical protein [Clostridia bacterium]